MIGQGRPHKVRVSLLFAISFLGTVTPGCATFRTRQPDPEPEPKRIAMRPMQVHPPETQDTATASHDQREQATLDAVEQFLARTEEYDAHGAAPSPAPRHSRSGTSLDDQQGSAKPQGKPEIVVSQIAPKNAGATENRAIANSEISLTSDTATSAPTIRSVAIRPLKPALMATTDTAKVVGTTNKPLDIRAAGQPASIDGFVKALRKTAEKEGDFDAAWRYRVVERVLGRRGAEIDDLALSASKAKPLLTSLLDTMDAVQSLAHDPLATGEEALQAVGRLQELVAEQADPVVDTIAFCRRVVTFGVYDEMGADEFVVGRPVSTIVYSEIRNLSSEKAPDGSHRTVFASRMELLTAAGQSVWQHEEPEIVDRCRHRRNDFFVAQRVTLPATLAAGDYVLKVFIEDKLSGKASEATREFSTSSQDTLTARR